MRTYLECFPCMVNQVLDGARRAVDDPAIRERILREFMRSAADTDLSESPPVMIARAHRAIRKLTGNPDPYRDVKKQFNESALVLADKFRETIRSSSNPLETAVRLAIAGNIIDFAANPSVDNAGVSEAIERALTAPLPETAVADFAQAVDQAEDILYLGDNAGEIVFDKLLIEQLPREKITFVVKNGPIINDATMEDAQAVGMTDLVPVIDNGADIPGTVLSHCSESFRKRFYAADLIISKGQGNYESVSDEDQNIFFLFTAKCIVMTLDSGYDVGRIVLTRA